jgi:hypothetical protein
MDLLSRLCYKKVHFGKLTYFFKSNSFWGRINPLFIAYMSQDINQNNQTSADDPKVEMNFNSSSETQSFSTQQIPTQQQVRTFSNEVFSWEVYAGKNRTYFFTLKEDKNNELYMTIKEVRYCADGTKDVHRIIVFEKDFANFQQGFHNSMSFVRGRRPQAFAPRIRQNYVKSESRESYSQASTPEMPTKIVSNLEIPLATTAFVTQEDVLELN